MNQIQLPPRAEFFARVRAALDARELQCQQPGYSVAGGCRYTGPCAIGVVLTKEQQSSLDDYIGEDDTEIATFIRLGVVKKPDDVTVAEIMQIQWAHDRGNVDDLRRLLS